MRPEYRLRSRADFKRVLTEGSRETGADLVFHYIRTEHGPPRVGFAVGRRVGGAVRRNRIRRRLREAIRPLLERIEPCDIVVSARRTIGDASTVDMQRLLREAAMRAGLLET